MARASCPQRVGSNHTGGRGHKLSERVALGYCLGMNGISLNCGAGWEEHKEKISSMKGQGIWAKGWRPDFLFQNQ